VATFDYRESDGPDPGIQDRADIAAGIEQAYRVTAADQQAAHDFFVANGAQVIGGHPQVRRPGAQGDPDPSLDASDE
jgi:hypothetical protein